MTEVVAGDQDAPPRSPPEAVRFPPGAQVRVRDEQWLVRQVTRTRHDGWMLEVTGVSPFVRGTEAVFYESLDDIDPLDPRKTKLVADDSPHHRRARLYMEAVIRKTALPQTERGLALADGFLMNRQTYQLRPAELALSMRNPQPRLLIADIVGLGKTLEIGLLLAELIRRGRGERILVVTPAHVLEQFQRELWTRFSLPLVRLDSTGIERIQQEIPAGRNPFAYFKRAIISVDTLKGRLYESYLDHTDWDVVVIDESHNLVNRATRNNKLAHRLARKTDALILASATPHNGDARSFAELVAMLDEAAIADPTSYDVGNLDHVYIRRTKNSREVRDSLTGDWADRGPSMPVHAAAKPAEHAVLEELATRWIPREPGGKSVTTHQLTPWNLLKGFLSSHRALQQTIETRLRTAVEPERSALHELAALAEQVERDGSAKADALVEVLREYGVGPRSTTRVVVFSERIPTLRWLAKTIPGQLGFRTTTASDPNKPWSAYGGAVEVMHGDATSIDEQKKIIENFGLGDTPVRILFTGDVASEGVNLHHQCHHMVHYDLPWSLIRIEQRNGRIDRYGQKLSPEYRAILLTSDVEWRTGDDGAPLPFDDRLVGEKLLQREEQAHKIEGSAEAVTGLYRPKDEEDRLTRDLIAGRTMETSLQQSKQERTPFLADLLGTVSPSAAPTTQAAVDVATATVPTLFASTERYFDEALRLIYPRGPEDEIRLRRDTDGTIAFEPPPDLQYRLRWLPHSYLTEQHILPRAGEPGRLRMTFAKKLADERLDAALASSKTQWPNVSFASPIHPVLEWVTDKALAALRHDQAFVLAAGVEEPVYLVQGVYSNALGRPTVVEWMAVSSLPDTPRVVEMDAAFLACAGITPDMAGQPPRDLDGLQSHVGAAIDAAAGYLTERRGRYDEQVDDVLTPYLHRFENWLEQLTLFGPASQDEQEKEDRRRRLLDSLRTSGAPMTRLLAVLEPR